METLYAPSIPVDAERDWAVAMLVAVISALATIAPEGSVTIPESEPVLAD